jgi:hypothetical protein
MSLIAGSEEFKLGVEMRVPESGFGAWHGCEEVVLLFFSLE